MDNLTPGQSIGPYRIINQIGQGGMATVYRAFHAAMDRYVALKVLPRQLAASPEFTGRFEHEARLIAKLEHAHILPVHDYGTADGITYLAMRYVEAGTLKDRLQAGPLSPHEIDRFFTQLADALDYAHGLGIVHRDLKPSNVLLDRRGNLFLTDFGIAKLLEGSPQFTSTGAMIGTPAYMSPEQAQGLRIDLRTDIYSLGIVLYEMVIGRVPFEADTPFAVVLKHVNEPLPLPSTLRPDVPPAVERVLLKALAKQREDRFATTAEFIQAWHLARPALLSSSPETASRAPGAFAPPTMVDAPVTPLPTALPTAAAVLPAQPATSQVSVTPLPIPAAPGAPASGGLPPSPAPARSRSPLPLLGLAAAALLLVVGVVACSALALLWYNNQNLASLSPTNAPDATTAGVISEGGWQSWASTNTIWAVALTSDDQLVTGGPGNVTGWDMSADTPDTQLTGVNGLPSPNVAALLFDPDSGLLWIGTDDGLVSTDGQSLTVYRQEDGLDSNAVFALARTSQGLLAGSGYSAEEGAGLNLLTADGWQPVPDFPSCLCESQLDRVNTFVRAILEDDSGNLWVGTNFGLAVFDGSAWTVYNTADGLPNYLITSLALVEGEVWVGTNVGLARFTGAGFELVSDQQDMYINGILQTSAGEVWVSSYGGLARRATSDANWRFYGADALSAYSLTGGVEASDGSLYFGSDNGVVRITGDERTHLHAPNTPTLPSFGAIRPAPEPGRLWFVEEYGIYLDVYDLNDETWHAGPTLPCDYCAPLAWDDSGRLWAGGDLGLWIIDPTGDAAVHLTTAQGLPAEGVYSVAFAPTGETWLGTAGGVALYDGTTVTAVYNSSDGLSSDYINGVWVTSDGALWAAAEYGLSRRDLDGNWTHFGAGDPFQGDVRVHDLVEDDNGTIWLATGGDGLYRYADGAWTRYGPDETGGAMPTTEVLCLALAPDGSLWLGFYFDGAAHFDGETWEVFNVEDGLIHSNVNDIYFDEQGSVWFATSGGVSRYRP